MALLMEIAEKSGMGEGDAKAGCAGELTPPHQAAGAVFRSLPRISAQQLPQHECLPLLNQTDTKFLL